MKFISVYCNLGGKTKICGKRVPLGTFLKVTTIRVLFGPYPAEIETNT